MKRKKITSTETGVGSHHIIIAGLVEPTRSLKPKNRRKLMINLASTASQLNLARSQGLVEVELYIGIGTGQSEQNIEVVTLQRA